MHELWFWLVAVISASPAGIRETSGMGLSFSTQEVGHA